MNQRQAKIEALQIAGDLCISRDAGMWYPDDFTISTKDIEKILDELSKIGMKLLYRADKLINHAPNHNDPCHIWDL